MLVSLTFYASYVEYLCYSHARARSVSKTLAFVHGQKCSARTAYNICKAVVNAYKSFALRINISSLQVRTAYTLIHGKMQRNSVFELFVIELRMISTLTVRIGQGQMKKCQSKDNIELFICLFDGNSNAVYEIFSVKMCTNLTLTLFYVKVNCKYANRKQM